MKRIEWENYQDGDSTPLNAENLNLMQDNIESELSLKADKVMDTGWVDIPLNTGITTGSMGQTPQYRKIGNKVEIRGDVAFTASSSAIFLANSLPSNIRPNSNQYFMSSLGGTRIMRFGMSANGYLFIDWVFNLTGTQVTTGNIAWAQINLTFYIE